ncbi:MAG TPA: FAD binding domain-containing protein [Terriglobales bacterium]
MSLPEFQYLRPRSIGEAVEMLGKHAPSVQILAGGTDLLPSLKQQLFAPRHLVDLGGVRELSAILPADGGLQIGAMTTLTNLERSREVAQRYPVLHEAVKTVASPVLRNMGTVGGNICLDTRCLWYNQSLAWRKSCGFCIKKDGDLCHVAPGGSKCWAAFSADTPPALLCLEAEIEIASPRGVRRMPLAEFYNNDGVDRMKLAKDELLTRVILPARTAGWRGAYRKLRVRGSIDYPLAGVAVALQRNGTVSEARIAITGVNPAPLLVRADSLTGRELSDELAAQVADIAAKAAKPLTTSALTPEYRREMVRVFTRRALLAAGAE